MRTYKVQFLVGTRCIHTATIKAANRYDAMATAKLLTLPTLEQPDNVIITHIKNKGDRK